MRSIALAFALTCSAGAQLVAPHWHGANAWRRDVPCLREVQPRNGCVSMRDGRSVCRAARDDGDDLTIRDAGRVLHAWHAGVIGPAEGNGAFYRADLDGDGRDELIVTTLETVSNGMAIGAFQIVVIDGRDAAAPPLFFSDEDFDPRVSFLRAPGGSRCRFFETEWLWAADRRRGDGFYLTGQWLDYRDGALVPVTSRPLLARRLLFRFEKEMAHGNAWDWLRSANAEAVASLPRRPPEPGCSDRTIEHFSATIAAVSDEAITLTVDGGRSRVVKMPYVLIDAPSGRTFPIGYVPARPVLTGRRADVITDDPYGMALVRVADGH
jgi:hypothetical protein